jgi:hypothetical protein
MDAENISQVIDRQRKKLSRHLQQDFANAYTAKLSI